MDCLIIHDRHFIAARSQHLVFYSICAGLHIYIPPINTLSLSCDYIPSVWMLKASFTYSMYLEQEEQEVYDVLLCSSSLSCYCQHQNVAPCVHHMHLSKATYSAFSLRFWSHDFSLTNTKLYSVMLSRLRFLPIKHIAVSSSLMLCKPSLQPSERKAEARSVCHVQHPTLNHIHCANLFRTYVLHTSYVLYV